MAEVINIRTVPFDLETEETSTLGECSYCGHRLLSQWMHGFPTRCPYCSNELENGADEREWIPKLYPDADGKSPPKN